MVKEVLFENREVLFNTLTRECEALLTNAVKGGHRASFIVSGGSTPAPLYEALSTVDLGWECVDVALVDERWVEPENEKSNQRLLQNTLLKNYGAQARFTEMKTKHDTALAAQDDVNAAYRMISQPFDLVVLGMGPDGHTASLFPQAEGLEQAINLDNSAMCAAITANQSAVTGEQVERMTLTLSGICRAKHILLLITGDEKLAVYQQALKSGSPLDTPVSAVLQQEQCPVSVYWAP